MNKCNSQKAGKYDYKNEDTSLPAEGGEGSYPFKCLTDIKKNAKKKSDRIEFLGNLPLETFINCVLSLSLSCFPFRSFGGVNVTTLPENLMLLLTCAAM